jgi:hypothetical protein
LRVDSLCLKGYNFSRFVQDCLPLAFGSNDLATACCNLIGSMASNTVNLYDSDKAFSNFTSAILKTFPGDKVLVVTACFAIAHLINSNGN